MKLVAGGRKVRYWRARLSNQINRRDSSLRLIHLGRTLEIPWKHWQTEELASKITLARRELKLTQKNAAEIRDKMLEERAKHRKRITKHAKNERKTIKEIH